MWHRDSPWWWNRVPYAEAFSNRYQRRRRRWKKGRKIIYSLWMPLKAIISIIASIGQRRRPTRTKNKIKSKQKAVEMIAYCRCISFWRWQSECVASSLSPSTSIAQIVYSIKYIWTHFFSSSVLAAHGVSHEPPNRECCATHCAEYINSIDT